MISVKDLSISSPQGAPLLCEISAHFPSGKINVIMGPNGSGKTTLLKAICQLQKDLTGSVMIDGKLASSFDQLELASKISWTESEHHTPFAYHVEDIIQWGRWPCHQGRPTKKDHDIVRAAADAFGITDKLGHSINHLSLGERKKTYLAKSIAGDAPHLIWDEPCGALDIRASVELMKLARHEVLKGKTAIMSLHDIDLALCFADNIAVLKDGKLTWQGSPADLNCRPALSEAFGLTLNESWGNPSKFSAN